MNRKKAIQENRTSTAEAPSGETTGSVACRSIVAKLLAGEFKSGEMLNENRLAKELDGNRTGVHEALLHLASIDVLEYVPFCGFRLKKVTLRDMLEWEEVRLAAEPIAARLCAERLPREGIKAMEALLEMEDGFYAKKDMANGCRCDNAFHLKMVESCGNRRLVSLYTRNYLSYNAVLTIGQSGCWEDGHGNRVSGFNGSAEIGDPIQWQMTAYAEHRQILDHIVRGAAAEAEALVRLHIDRIIAKIKNYLVGQALAAYPAAATDSTAGARSMTDLIVDNLRQQMPPI